MENKMVEAANMADQMLRAASQMLREGNSEAGQMLARADLVREVCTRVVFGEIF